MSLTVEMQHGGRAHFTHTVCEVCKKKVMVTYTIPFLCTRCGQVMDANIVFLHKRIKFRHRYHTEGASCLN